MSDWEFDDDGENPRCLGADRLNAIAETNPEAAQEIRRLQALMESGDDVPDEDFLRLCQLLYDVDEKAHCESLLRCNVEGSKENQALYIRLFGTAKQEELDAAIEALKSQFGLDLDLVESDFLISNCKTGGGPSRSDEFHLFSHPCEFTISYILEDKPEAVIEILDDGCESCHDDPGLFLYFENGVWEIADPMGDLGY